MARELALIVTETRAAQCLASSTAGPPCRAFGRAALDSIPDATTAWRREKLSILPTRSRLRPSGRFGFDRAENTWSFAVPPGARPIGFDRAFFARVRCLRHLHRRRIANEPGGPPRQLPTISLRHAPGFPRRLLGSGSRNWTSTPMEERRAPRGTWRRGQDRSPTALLNAWRGLIWVACDLWEGEACMQPQGDTGLEPLLPMVRLLLAIQVQPGAVVGDFGFLLWV